MLEIIVRGAQGEGKSFLIREIQIGLLNAGIKSLTEGSLALPLDATLAERRVGRKALENKTVIIIEEQT